MNAELHILLLEDREKDAELTLRELRRDGLDFTVKQVLTEADFLAELRNPALGLILADYALPAYDGLSALASARELRPEVPFIFVTGTMGEENAIGAMHQGATDYVLKQRLSRLRPAVRRALREVEEHRQREQAVEGLREAENRFRVLFEQSPDGIVIIDPETARIIEFNEAAHRQLGYSREEFARLSIADIEATETPADVRTRVDRVCKDGKEDFDTRHRTQHGEIRDIHVTVQIIEVAGASVFHSVWRDITERKRAESALRESQDNLARAESFSHVMVCHVALDGRWLKTPPLLSQLLGYSADELLAGRIQDRFHPEDAAQNWQQMRRLTASDCQTFGEEKRFMDRQGSVLWLDFHCTLVPDANQQPVLFLIYLRDITQTKRWEEKTLQQARLLNLAPDAIILRDTEDVIFYWNQGAERLYGWTAEKAIGRKTTDLFCKNPALAETAKRMVMELGEWAGEAQQLTKAGQEVTVSSRWTLLNEPGHAPVILAIDTDITEQKSLEAQFLRAQRLESVGRLASGIAHDLNNILVPMLMAPSILREELKNEASKGMIDTIEKNAMRGAEIVKQLLTFGRGTESQRGPVQLRSLIRDMMAIMRATFPKNITTHSDTAADPWLVTANATQMHQVLMNLCVNARDAMPNGGQLTLALENTLLDESIASMMPGSKAGPYMLLTVTDTGTGITPEHLDRIFDPFFTTKDPGQGTGLGLSTVLGIVRHHDGFILVKSKVGQGTQFKVYLPATRNAQMAPAKELEKLPQGSGELILVVDDEENIRIMLRRTLERNGYRALMASDGTEALALYAQNQKQVRAVITDLWMPFMDGPSLIRALRRLDPDLKILTISGLLSEPGGDPPLEAQAFLTKPFGSGALLRALDELLRGKAKMDAESS